MPIIPRVMRDSPKDWIIPGFNGGEQELTVVSGKVRFRPVLP